MHKIEEIEKALWINRNTLRCWRDKRKKGEPLISRKRDKSSKWSKTELEKYLIWFKNKRIKKRLGYLSPKEFMLNYNQY